MKTIAILQSSYIPWKGYFDLINLVDEFVIYDNVQYTRRDWRNRNIIKTREGLKWLTIPVRVKGRYSQKINETRTVDSSWALKHWKTICNNYSKAPFFDKYYDILEQSYDTVSGFEFLSEINIHFLRLLSGILGINTIFKSSNYYLAEGNRTEKIISICKQAGADKYISGPSAKSYINTKLFDYNGIVIEWVDYSLYPEYKQLYPPFVHKVSIIDLILNTGDKAINYI